MVHRHLHEGIPQAHVAAEFRVSRPTVATWVARYRAQGEAGLQDRSSRPHRSPAQLDPALVTQILTLRRECKWSARRIHHHLVSEGHPVCLRTVGRWLHRLGISRLRDLAPTGENLRQRPQKITARAPGHMVHLDVKKIGRIPEGRGWRANGRDSEAGRASKRGSGRRDGYTYLHSAIDGHTRLAYTEALEDEKAVTTIGFFCRARAFFAAHGITVDRVVTDNGSNYRAAEFTQKVVSLGGRHHRIRPYTPRHNGKVERYNRLMVDQVLYARPYTSENQRREALAVWVNHYNYHRPHTTCGDAPRPRWPRYVSTTSRPLTASRRNLFTVVFVLLLKNENYFACWF